MKYMFLHQPGISMHQKFHQDIPKTCITEFPLLSVLKRPLCGLVIFIGMEHIYTYKKQEFQNIIERNYAIALGS